MSSATRVIRRAFPEDATYKVALYTEPVEYEAYSAEKEWEGFGYKAGGNVLTGYRVDEEDGEAILRFSATEWVDADIQARCAMIYNADTGEEVNTMVFPRTVGVFGGLFELKMPDEGVYRLK